MDEWSRRTPEWYNDCYAGIINLCCLVGSHDESVQFEEPQLQQARLPTYEEAVGGFGEWMSPIYETLEKEQQQ